MKKKEDKEEDTLMILTNKTLDYIHLSFSFILQGKRIVERVSKVESHQQIDRTSRTNYQTISCSYLSSI